MGLQSSGKVCFVPLLQKVETHVGSLEKFGLNSWPCLRISHRYGSKGALPKFKKKTSRGLSFIRGQNCQECVSIPLRKVHEKTWNGSDEDSRDMGPSLCVCCWTNTNLHGQQIIFTLYIQQGIRIFIKFPLLDYDHTPLLLNSREALMGGNITNLLVRSETRWWNHHRAKILSTSTKNLRRLKRSRRARIQNTENRVFSRAWLLARSVSTCHSVMSSVWYPCQDPPYPLEMLFLGSSSNFKELPFLQKNKKINSKLFFTQIFFPPLKKNCSHFHFLCISGCFMLSWVLKFCGWSKARHNAAKHSSIFECLNSTFFSNSIAVFHVVFCT